MPVSRSPTALVASCFLASCLSLAGCAGASGEGGVDAAGARGGAGSDAGGRGGSSGVGGATSGTTGDAGNAGAAGTAGIGGAAGGAGATATGGTVGAGGSSAGTGGAMAGVGGSIAGTGGAAGTSSARGGAGGSGGVGGAGGRGGAGTAGAGASAGAAGSGGAGGSAGAGGRGGAGTAGTTSNEPKFVTSAEGAYWKTGACTETATGTAEVTVNDASASQTWEGFGGAFNELGWTYLTSKAMQDQAVQLLFGNDGARFNWGRIPIGASDYGVDRYTLNESTNDTAMTNFSIARDLQRLIPYIKAAQAVKADIRFWASPWTPPTWMKSAPYKTPGNPVNAFDGGGMRNEDAMLKALATYFVKFVAAYAQQGIKVDYVAPQNEPGYTQNYPSCSWSPEAFTSFIGKYLGPALAVATPTAQIMLGTMSNAAADRDLAVANAVLADATAKSYSKVIGVQWGMSDAAQITNLKSRGPGISIWLSEHRCGGTQGADVPAAPNDFAYGKSSWNNIRDAIKNGVTAYNAWNMVLDKGGRGIDNTRIWAQNALLIADGGTVTATPAYYVFRHFSQFVDVGAKVVASTGGDTIAFKNPDGSIVAVIYNSGAAKTSIVSIGGKKLQCAVPGNGWATVNYTP